MKRSIFPILLIFVFSLSVSTSAYGRDSSPKKYIEDRLVEKGLNRNHVRVMLNDPRISMDSGIIIKNLFYSSPKGTEEQPEYMEIDPVYIKKGKRYINDNASVLSSIEKKYGIPPEVITAILIVESRLGTYPEKYHVFFAYTNLAALLDPEYLKGIQKTYIDQYPSLNDEATLNRAKKKATWALNELYQLIVLADSLNLDPLDIIGSFAGAIGPAQFIPSSFMDYGVDGDHDGKKDPFNMTDAMASIAYYLQRAGWKENAGLEKKRQAVWYYNHSDVYVNTIIMLYEKLKT